MGAITKLLAQENWIMLSRDLIKQIGLDEAIIIGELCSEENYWKKENKLKYGEWFFSTRENIKDSTGLSEHRQRNAIEHLKELDIIQTDLIGIPAKLYYRINEDALEDILKKDARLAMQKVIEQEDDNFTEQDGKNLHLNNKQDNNTQETRIVKGKPFTAAEPRGVNHSRNFRKETETLTDDLGGLTDAEPKKEEKPKKKNLYQKCLDAIDDPKYMFTDDVKQALRDFLPTVMQKGPNDIKGIGQWTYKLQALTGFSKDSSTQLQIIQQSLNEGLVGFRPIGYKESTFVKGTHKSAASIDNDWLIPQTLHGDEVTAEIERRIANGVEGY